jgi:RNA polymerase sigma-70 factor (ECF subfamily)
MDTQDLQSWERNRHALLGLAYRMLGDRARAEDLVQEAWIRWSGRTEREVADPRSYLVAVVTRLCLNELGSARARREESRGNRLPEPVAAEAPGLGALEQISMALLVALQRLTPAERAVLLLHDVFDYGHAEVGRLVGKTEAACRKMLSRARSNLAAESRMQRATREEHERLLDAFVRAVSAGDVAGLASLLAADAVIVTDGGAAGRQLGGFQSLPDPLQGSENVAAFVCEVSRRNGRALELARCELNGQPAVLFRLGGQPFAALLLGVDGGHIHRIYFQADAARLTRLG